MSVIDLYGAVAVALIAVVFYFVRKIPAYIGICAAIVVGFAVVTFPMVDLHSPSDWMVMTVGLGLSSFGLLIVRVMLVRSISLRLLRSMDGTEASTFGDDLSGRLGDMRAFHLIQTVDGGDNVLTPFGRFVGGVVHALYSIFRMGA